MRGQPFFDRKSAATVFIVPTDDGYSVVKNNELCSDNQPPQPLDHNEWCKVIKIWRRRVKAKSKHDYEITFPNLHIVGLMPTSTRLATEMVNTPAAQPLASLTSGTRRLSAIDCEPSTLDMAKPPRKGSFKHHVLTLTQQGATMRELIKASASYYRGDNRTPARLRVLETLRLLHAENGVGFRTKGETITSLFPTN